MAIVVEDGGFRVEVLADSLSPMGFRLITLLLRYPRCIHSEFMTHREFSRNAASSRAIPVKKMLKTIWFEPFVPIWWGANEAGMQANAELEGWRREAAELLWRTAGVFAVLFAWLMARVGAHKQIVNRLVEPWMWIQVIASTTSLTNFLGLRDHKAAEPHFQKLARMVRFASYQSVPRKLQYGEWHLPYVTEDDRKHYAVTDLVKMSVGRCARVSYLTHDGKRAPFEDVALHDKLMVQEPLHASPAEHQAVASQQHWHSGNLRGDWLQYRKTFANEYIK